MSNTALHNLAQNYNLLVHAEQEVILKKNTLSF